MDLDQDISTTPVGVALSALSSALDGLIDVVEGGGLDDLAVMGVLEAARGFERVRNQMALVDHQIVSDCDRRQIPDELNLRTTCTMLIHVLHLSFVDAGRRVRGAAAAGQRTTMTGAPLAPPRPVLAAAQRAGEMTPEQLCVAEEALRAMDTLGVTPDKMTAAEQSLADHSRAFDPRHLTRIAEKLLEAAAPDGSPPNDDIAQQRRRLRMSTGRDGAVRGTFCLTPDVGAALTAVLAPLATPRKDPPGQGGHLADAHHDSRTPKQRLHDALGDLCSWALRGANPHTTSTGTTTTATTTTTGTTQTTDATQTGAAADSDPAPSDNDPAPSDTTRSDNDASPLENQAAENDTASVPDDQSTAPAQTVASEQTAAPESVASEQRPTPVREHPAYPPPPPSSSPSTSTTSSTAPAPPKPASDPSSTPNNSSASQAKPRSTPPSSPPPESPSPSDAPDASPPEPKPSPSTPATPAAPSPAATTHPNGATATTSSPGSMVDPPTSTTSPSSAPTTTPASSTKAGPATSTPTASPPGHPHPGKTTPKPPSSTLRIVSHQLQRRIADKSRGALQKLHRMSPVAVESGDEEGKRGMAIEGAGTCSAPANDPNARAPWWIEREQELSAAASARGNLLGPLWCPGEGDDLADRAWTAEEIWEAGWRPVDPHHERLVQG